LNSAWGGKWWLNWKFFIGILLSAFFLLLAFQKVDFEAVKAALAHANYVFLLPAVALTFISLFFRAVRWFFLLRPIKKTRLSNLFAAIMIGFALNFILPVRIGEFARAYSIGKKENLSKAASFATLVVERLLDGMTIIGFFAIIILFWSFPSPPWVYKSALVVLGLFLGGLVFLVLLRFQSRRILTWVGFVLRPFPSRFKVFVISILENFIQGLRIFNNPRSFLISAVLSLLVWLPAGLVVHFLLLGFDIRLPIAAAFLVLVVLCTGLMIPAAPGFVGTFQFFCILGLSLFGVEKDVALSFSIVYHASQFIPVTVVGLAYMRRFNKAASPRF